MADAWGVNSSALWNSLGNSPIDSSAIWPSAGADQWPSRVRADLLVLSAATLGVDHMSAACAFRGGEFLAAWLGGPSFFASCVVGVDQRVVAIASVVPWPFPLPCFSLLRRQNSAHASGVVPSFIAWASGVGQRADPGCWPPACRNFATPSMRLPVEWSRVAMPGVRSVSLSPTPADGVGHIPFPPHITAASARLACPTSSPRLNAGLGRYSPLPIWTQPLPSFVSVVRAVGQEPEPLSLLGGAHGRRR